MATLKNTKIDDTGYLQLPTGSTAERPGSPETGYSRFNTSSSLFEIYDGSEWKNLDYEQISYDIEYLIVAGGGAGGRHHGGGGGAGGFLSGSIELEKGDYTVVIGSGGTPTAGSTSSPNIPAGNGGNSEFHTIISTGGGGGGNYNAGGASGGSGGGPTNWSTSQSGGAGTSGQGFSGASNNGQTNYGGGGGGAGSSPTTSNLNDGGIGKQSSITGTPTYYAGGGAAGTYPTYTNYTGANTGGTGGGGAGGVGPHSSGTNGTSGTSNTGGGGGGTAALDSLGGNGGSGIVILRYPSLLSATLSGGATTPSNEGEQTDGSFKYIRIITSGTVTFS